MEQVIKSKIKEYYNFINQFWFSPQSLFRLSMMRFALGCVLTFLAISRQGTVDFLFSNANSIVPLDMAPKMIPEYYRPTFFYFVWTDAQIYWAHLAYVVSLVIFTLGLGGRFLTLLTWFLHIGFLQRNYSVVFGADLIGGLWLFYLSWTKHSEFFTLKSLWNKKPKQEYSESGDWLTSAGYRMIQLQLSVIYAYTGWEKLKGTSWWEGTSLWTVLGNPQMAIVNFDFMLSFPWVIAILVYATLIFEIYFPFLVLSEKTRKGTLVFGLLFHLGIAFSMKGIWPFSIIMMAAYPLFSKYDSKSFKY